MSRRKFGKKPAWHIAIAALSLALILYVAWNEQGNETQDVSSGLVFPNLLDELNSVSSIVVATAQEGEMQIGKSEGTWVVREYHGYPADVEKVLQTLYGMAQVRKIESIAADRSHYASLGVGDTSSPDSNAIKLTLSREASQVAELLIGKSRSSSASASSKEYYARIPGDEQVWLVEGEFSEFDSSLDWLDRNITSLEKSRIEESRIVSGTSSAIRVSRAATQKDFQLDNVPDGKKTRFQYQLNDIGTVLSDLKFEDVILANGWAQGVGFETRTYDGLIVRGALGKGDKSHYAIFDASFVDHSDESVQLEAQSLKQRWKGWAYRLSDVRVKTLHYNFDDLIEDVISE